TPPSSRCTRSTSPAILTIPIASSIRRASRPRSRNWRSAIAISWRRSARRSEFGEDRVMRHTSLLTIACALIFAVTPRSQGLQPVKTPGGGAGVPPCVGSDGGFYQCPPAGRVTAIRAGRLFDSKAGVMLTRHVILLQGDRITAVGPEAQ